MYARAGDSSRASAAPKGATLTLIIGLLNHRQAILVSDRRFTVDGKFLDLGDDERCKTAAFFCNDARMAVAFTGLARAGKFDTSTVILEELLRAGEPDHLFLPTVDRFITLMAERIEQTGLPKSACHLTIVFAGYRFDGQRGLPEIRQITNWMDGRGRPQTSANETFVHWHAKNSLGIFGFGMRAGVLKHDRQVLLRMVAQEKPYTALVNKVVDAIRNAADSDKSKGLVGKQCDSIVIPSEPHRGAMVDYHSSSPSDVAFLPSYAISTSNSSFSCRGGFIRGSDQQGNPALMAWPRVGRNQPCPCGSGKKFKRCHGRANPRGA